MWGVNEHRNIRSWCIDENRIGRQWHTRREPIGGTKPGAALPLAIHNLVPADRKLPRDKVADKISLPKSMPGQINHTGGTDHDRVRAGWQHIQQHSHNLVLLLQNKTFGQHTRSLGTDEIKVVGRN